MKIEQTKNLSDANFHRNIGIKRTTFNAMIAIVKEAKTFQADNSHKLSIENLILMMLEYLRNYRTYVQIEFFYGNSKTRFF